MNPVTDISRQKMFLRQLIIASKRANELDNAKKEIENHLDLIKGISSEGSVKKELKLLNARIRKNIYKEKIKTKDKSKSKIEDIEKRLVKHHKKINAQAKTKKKTLEESIKRLEQTLIMLSKKYPKKDLKNLKEKINSLTERICKL